MNHDHQQRVKELQEWHFAQILDLDQDEARAAYIGRRYSRYESFFENYDEADGGFCLSFHWQAFVGGFFWFLYRQLYLVGGLMVFSDVIALVVIDQAPRHFYKVLAVVLIIRLLGALTAKWLLARLVDQKIEQALAMSENSHDRAIGWLKYNGQGNLKIPIGVALVEGYLIFRVILPYFVLALYVM